MEIPFLSLLYPSIDFYIQMQKIILTFRKTLIFSGSLKFKTMNMQKQPEKKQFPTSSSLVVFYTNDFFDLIDKSIS